jgi:hypothetical protein
VLDGDHKALADAALPVCARYGLAVAGGYVVKAHGLVERPSEDVDFATCTAAPVWCWFPRGSSGLAAYDGRSNGANPSRSKTLRGSRCARPDQRPSFRHAVGRPPSSAR